LLHVQRQSDWQSILDNPEHQHVQSNLGSDHPDFAKLDGFTFINGGAATALSDLLFR
jgi:hypothetical protein